MIHLATATDRQYLPWCATTVLSASRATPQRCVFHVIAAPDVTPHDRRRLMDVLSSSDAQLNFIPLPSKELAGLPSAVAAHGGAISCARFLLPRLLPDIDRLIYLDADTLTVDSLEPLWRTDLDGHALAAVANVVEPLMRTRIAQLGLKDPMRYLNSGVLLMDLARMRALDSASALMECAIQADPELLWVDQDALNLVFEDAWLRLDPRWNVQNSMLYWRRWAEEVYEPPELAAAVASPAVLHFEGPSLAKPWHYLSKHPYTSRYRAALAETPWHGAAPTERTLFNRMIKPLSRARQVQALIAVEAAKQRTRKYRCAPWG